MPDRFDRYCHFKQIKLRQDEDWVSIYDGREGSGKSTGAIWDAYNTSGNLFDLHKHICYDPLEFVEIIDKAPRYGTIILDEAGEMFFSRTFRDQLNITIAKILQQMRFRNLNVIFCVPHKDYIDLIGRARCRSWCHFSANKRGRAEFMMPFRGKYHSRDEPFWKTQFYYQFSPLPRPVYQDYRKIKEDSSRARAQKYGDAIRKKTEKQEKLTVEDVIEKVQELDSIDVLNSKGKYDSDMIELKLGVSRSLARVSARKLNSSPLI